MSRRSAGICWNLHAVEDAVVQQWFEGLALLPEVIEEFQV
jgi:hypothetical protein